MVSCDREVVEAVTVHLDGASPRLTLGMPVERNSPAIGQATVKPFKNCGFLPFAHVAKVLDSATKSGHGAIIREIPWKTARGEMITRRKLVVLPCVKGDTSRPWLTRQQLRSILGYFASLRTVGIQAVYPNDTGLNLILTGRVPGGSVEYLPSDTFTHDGVKFTLALKEFNPPVVDMVTQALSEAEEATEMAAAFAAAM